MAAAVGTAYFVSTRTPPQWKASAQLLLVQRSAPMISSTNGSGASPFAMMGTVTESADTQVAMLQNILMAQNALDWLKNDAISKGRTATEFDDLNAERLQKAISAAVLKDTNIIEVTVDAASRDRAKALADGLCEAFVKYKKQIADTGLQEMVTSIETRLTRARAQMVEADRQDINYKRTHKLVDVSMETTAAYTEYLRRHEEVKQAKQSLEVEEKRVQALRAQLKGTNQALTNSGPRDDTTVLALQAELDDLQTQRSNLLLKYTDAHPDVRSLDQNISRLRTQVSAAVTKVLDPNRPTLDTQQLQYDLYTQAQTAAVIAKASLESAIRFRDQVQGQIKGMPQITMDYARIKQQAEVARSMYSSLEAALSSLNINKDMTTGNMQISQSAWVPEQPYKPDRIKDLAIGGGIGLFICLLTVLLLEQADRKIRDVDSVRRLVTGPIIGTLPRMSRSQMRQMMSGDTPSVAIESYNIARANLALAVVRDGQNLLSNGHVILVVSSVPGEGKSVSALEMARSIARSGKSVILVDADLRRPSINRLMGTNEQVGLANVLLGEVSLEHALVSSELETMAVLHAGQAQGSPTDMISMPVMARILEEMKSEVDVIVIDSPACSLFADALLLAPYADCIMHVVGSGTVDNDLVARTADAFGAAAPRTMVYFVNRAPKRSTRSYGYGYGYGYGYSRHANGKSANGIAHENGRNVLNPKAVYGDESDNEKPTGPGDRA